MREIAYDDIRDTVQTLVLISAYDLPQDVLDALYKALAQESAPVAKEALKAILENAKLAAQGQYPLCQDTGTAVIFVEIGQEVRIKGGLLHDAINQGVRLSYKKGYLRKSIVEMPYTMRANTQDNTPAVIHTEIVRGNKIKISFMAKGGGSENMSRLYMLKPSDGCEGIISSVVDAVCLAGGNPCPPLVIGIGVGGNAETAMIMSKKALLRKTGEPSKIEEDAALEQDILQAVNDSGVGTLGFGGTVTALGVHVLSAPCHMASLPLGINLGCHSARHAEIIL
ncbi:MAG: fumarate hydratase [Chloroflexi bacterium]|nr:fumarate hydratase [Chloroflexota bacterium]